jgi:hypothetical protein
MPEPRGTAEIAALGAAVGECVRGAGIASRASNVEDKRTETKRARGSSWLWGLTSGIVRRVILGRKWLPNIDTAIAGGGVRDQELGGKVTIRSASWHNSQTAIFERT